MSSISNALDRNHDGKVNFYDLKSNTGLAIPAAQPVLMEGERNYVAGSRLSTGLVRAEPTVMETIQKETVVHERIHPIQKEEIQPIIYREREQLDVKQVTQMMHETKIEPTLIQQRELPAQTREAIIERGAPIQPNFIEATRQVDATTRTQVMHAPIVNEVIKKTVIEEIQPVLERDIIQSTVIQNTQPIYEKIIEAPNVTREVRQVGERRLSQGFVEPMLLNQQAGLQSASVLPIQNRRLSQTYVEPALLHQQAGLQSASVLPIQKRRLSQTYVEPALLNQQVGLQQPMLGQTAPVQSRRLSQTYVDPLLLNQQAGLQQPALLPAGNRLSQTLSGNVGVAPYPGMNNTGIGMTNSIPLLNERRLSQTYAPAGVVSNGMISSAGVTGTSSLVSSVSAGQTMPMGQPLSGLDRNMDGKVDLQDLAPNAGKLRYAHSGPATLNSF